MNAGGGVMSADSLKPAEAVVPGLQAAKRYNHIYLKGAPIIGMVSRAVQNPLKLAMETAQCNADFIVTNMMGQHVIQLNHPGLVRHVLMDNHKNYKKSKTYIRFQSVGGLGLLTSYGDKWKKDRQKIQPLFNRKLITDNHFALVSEVAEKYKQRWLEACKNGPLELDIGYTMASMTSEIIMKTVFGRDIPDAMVHELHVAYDGIIDYQKNLRVIQSVDSRKLFCMPAYFRFKKNLETVDQIILTLSEKYRNKGAEDKNGMLALLVAAQKKDPEHFDEREIRDQCVTMIFAGFETTSILMHWLWYVLDEQPEVRAKLRRHIIEKAPCTGTLDSSALTYEEVAGMGYLDMVLKETMRLYPPFWVTGREPIEDDYFGDYKVKKGTLIALPQVSMHRHPRWWKDPNAFIPERFAAGNVIDEGIYFPFSLGPRRCIGSFFAEMEAMTIMAKLVPVFDVVAPVKFSNRLDPGVSLKLKHPLMVHISRAH